MDRIGLAIVMLAMVPACSTGTASTMSPDGDPAGGGGESTEVTASVGGAELTAAEVCSEQSVRSTVESFVEAYTNGDPDLVERFFAGEGRFQWYSEPPDRLSDKAFDRSTLESYLAQRYVDGDRLRVVELNYNGYRAEDETGHFDFVVRRHDVDDVIGKGAIDCHSGGIMVWSLGPNPGPTGT